MSALLTAELRGWRPGAIKFAVANGAAANADITVAGIAVGDAIRKALYLPPGVLGVNTTFVATGAAANADITVTGIAAGATILSAVYYPSVTAKDEAGTGTVTAAGLPVDVRAEMTATATNKVRCSSTDTTGGKLVVVFVATAAALSVPDDVTDEIAVTAAGKVQCTTTNTTGGKLLIEYLSAAAL